MVIPDPDPNPKFDDITCTREIAEETDYYTNEIRYMPGVVVNAIGFHSDGYVEDYYFNETTEKPSAHYELGGQVTLAEAH
jgi:hypothetical protein